MICSCQIVTPYVSRRVGSRSGCGAVAGGDREGGHAALDQAWAEQADVGDGVLRVPGLEPADQVLLARRLQLLCTRIRVAADCVAQEVS
ncbi:hypothetical protein GA0115280_1026124 [Streptomyces sp. Cmuel-A718b]|nr:hypothetical protein GA0115280_1026124 [Streptomyces sp. Cmuel-A718b]